VLDGPHRYLRAYLAGIAFPTAFLAVLLLLFLFFAATGRVNWSLGKLLAFPMAAVPNLWGLWNIAYVALSKRRVLNIGLFGSILPFIIGPLAYTAAKSTGPLPHHGWGTLAIGFVVILFAYYLIWKHVVRFINESLDLE
jgi:hypothetical protein